MKNILLFACLFIPAFTYAQWTQLTIPTTSDLFLQKNQFIKIELFDVHGRNIETLSQGNLSAGLHTLNFSSDGLARGIYNLKISSKDDTRYLKLIKQ